MLSFDEWKHEKVVEFAKNSTEYRVNRDEVKKKYFYYNKISKTSQWVKPPEIAEYENVLMKEYNITFNLVAVDAVIKTESLKSISLVSDASCAQLSENKKRKLIHDGCNDLSTSASPVVVNTPLETPDVKFPDFIEDMHTRQLAVENDMKRIESVLAQKDAIMEPDVAQQVKALIQIHKQPPATVVRSLVGTYTGYAQMSRIVLEWIALAEELNEPKAISNKQGGISLKLGVVQTEQSEEKASSVISVHPPLSPVAEETVVAVVAQLIRQRFNRSLVDDLVLQFRATPLWLGELMRDDAFRAMLMDLHAANPGSSFLGLCAREIETMDIAN
jgi:hypothetical protein